MFFCCCFVNFVSVVRFFEIGRITAAGRAAGAIVGWDLAHAVGNVILKVSDTRDNNTYVRNKDSFLFFRSHSNIVSLCYF